MFNVFLECNEHEHIMGFVSYAIMGLYAIYSFGLMQTQKQNDGKTEERTKKRTHTQMFRREAERDNAGEKKTKECYTPDE